MARDFIRSLAFLTGLFAVLMTAHSQEKVLPEYEVKALFLVNFARYVEWPAESFPNPATPVTIAVLGDHKFGTQLDKAIKDKCISGHPLRVRYVRIEDDLSSCHILFIPRSEKARMAQILKRLGPCPVLTVGESEQFVESGGVINMVRKDGKVRLEINLEAARNARLQMNSRLLGVADSIKGKAVP